MNLDQRDSVQSAKQHTSRWRWSLAVCGVLAVLHVVLPWPYWRDAMDGGLFYVTPPGLAGYVVSLAMTGAVFVGLIAARNSHSIPRWTILTSTSLVAMPVLKWAIVRYAGLEVFHNRMGLGQEIAGFIPNVVIDAALGVNSLALLVLLWRSRSRFERAHTDGVSGPIGTRIATDQPET